MGVLTLIAGAMEVLCALWFCNLAFSIGSCATDRKEC